MRPRAVLLDARSMPSLSDQIRSARRRRSRRRRAAAGALVAVPAALLVARLVSSGATAEPARASTTTRRSHDDVGVDRARARTPRRVRAGAGQRRRRRLPPQDHFRVPDGEGAGCATRGRGRRAGITGRGAVVGLPARPVDARAGPGRRCRRRPRCRLARRGGRPLRALPDPVLGVVALRVARALGGGGPVPGSDDAPLP
jgi:hypothetical protein